MNVSLQILTRETVFPPLQPPTWGATVDRWNQLDAFAFSLCDAYSHFRNQLKTRPDFIFLASREGSNRTDRLFVETGAISPSKFVHTLPNVRSAPLFQMAAWSGPSLCLQNDPQTEVTALIEAAFLLENDSDVGTVWILSVEPCAASYRARIYVLTTNDFKTNFRISSKTALSTENSSRIAPNDENWLRWLGSGENTNKFHLSNNFDVIRCPLEENRG